jgi:hypothetical protein
MSQMPPFIEQQSGRSPATAIETSIYARLCFDLPRLASTRKELDGLLGVRCSRLSVFRIARATASALCKALGEEATEAWDEIRGVNLLFGRDPRLVFHDGLRYCAECMKLGWHSILFQHRLVRRCPVHRCTLRIGCPRCRLPILPNLNYIAVNPMGCGNCGSSFSARFAKSRQEVSASGPPREPFDALRLSLKQAAFYNGSARDAAHWNFESRIPMDHTACPNADSVTSRHLDWEQGAAFSVRKHRTSELLAVCVGGDLSPTSAERLAAAAVVLLPPTSELDMRVSSLHASLIFQRHAYGRLLDIELTVCAAAFVLTMRQVFSELEWEQWGNLAGSDRPTSSDRLPSNRRHFVRHELVARMARNLVYASRLRNALACDWDRKVAPELFMPGWRESEGPVGMRVSIRPVCSIELLYRLIGRVGSRRLLGKQLPPDWLVDCREVVAAKLPDSEDKLVCGD